MNMEFATAAQAQEGFGTGLTAMLIGVSAMALAAYAGGRHLATPLRLRWVAVGYALALSLAVGTVYVSTWGRFVHLQVNGAGLELRYAGSWQLPVRVPRDQVQTVLVGWGKPGPALLPACGAARWLQPPQCRTACAREPVPRAAGPGARGPLIRVCL